MFLWDNYLQTLLKFQDDLHQPEHTAPASPTSSNRPQSKTKVTLAAFPFSMPCVCSIVCELLPFLI